MNTEREALFTALGWERPPALIDEALTHRSFTNERHGRGKRPPARDNQRLEFLGDSVLNLCVSELLMAAFPDADEGLLSRMRANLVNTDPLAEFGRAVGLGAALRLGRGSQASGDHEQANVLADAVEALVGAAYLDGGLTAARDLVGRIVGEGLRNAASLGGLDPKSALQERVQARGGSTPVYRPAADLAAGHDPHVFVVEVSSDGRTLGRGEGRTKKAAQQSAARDALERLASEPTNDIVETPGATGPGAP